MIHSARPTVSPVANIVSAWTLFCFCEKWRTDGRTDDMTLGRPRGSKREALLQSLFSYLYSFHADRQLASQLAKSKFQV